MKRIFQIMALGCIVLLSACSKAPKHARYVPADATFVLGVNTEELGKKAAWSTISGSTMMQDLLKNIDDQKGKEAVQGIDKAGIEFMSTFYIYSKMDKRFSGDNKFGIVLPLKDRKAWEAYLKKVSPETSVKTVKDRHEANIQNNMYAGWTDDVLIVMNGINQERKDETAMNFDINDTTLNIDSVYAAMAERNKPKFDEALTAAEMESTFNLSKDASIAENKRFKALEEEAHDITMFVNYDQLMNSNIADMGMMGMSMSKLYKGSAMTGAFDFNKGQLDGEMKYYPSDDMKEVVDKMSGSNVDKEMISRLPGQNLNMVAGMFLSPKGIKMMLDKMSLSIWANTFLAEKKMTIDDVLAAFSGDIVFSMNNLSMHKETMQFEAAEGMQSYDDYQPDMDILFAMKIGNRESLNKLLAMLNEEGLQPEGNTYTIPLPGGDNVTLTVGDKYIAASNKAPLVAAYLQGNIKPEMTDVAKKEVDGHPFGLFVDMQSIMTPFAARAQGSGSDSLVYGEFRKMLNHISMNGGEFKNGAIQYNMAFELMNKEENSLVQFINLAQRISDYNKKKSGDMVMK